MSKEQIEEIARNLCDVCKSEPSSVNCEKKDLCRSVMVEAESIYNAGYRKQEWISVDERLPEPKTDVLVLFADGGVTMDFRMPGYGFMYGNDVTHWMPLPEPPKMRKEDEGK